MTAKLLQFKQRPETSLGGVPGPSQDDLSGQMRKADVPSPPANPFAEGFLWGVVLTVSVFTFALERL